MKLPNKLFVAVDGEGEEQFLNAMDDLKDHGGDVGTKKKVGVYKLEKIVTVATEVSVIE